MSPAQSVVPDVANRPGPGGGRYGIRTHGDPEATTAFEAAPFVRSGNLPASKLPEAPSAPVSRERHGPPLDRRHSPRRTGVDPSRAPERIHAGSRSSARPTTPTGAPAAQPSAPFVEEAGDQGRRLVGPHARYHLDLMVEPGVDTQVVEGAAGAGLGIGGAEHHPVDPRRHQRTRAHRARLDR